MLALNPHFEFRITCPKCGNDLVAHHWLVPGMRNLAEVCCGKCDGHFYADLPAGQGMLTPATIEVASGEIFSPSGADWFGRWLKDGFARRRKAVPAIREENFRPLRRPLLLNCLDTLYGHELMKLMNAQHYLDNHSDLDLVVLIHANFRWLVPEGAAAVWILDMPLSQGTDWNDGLADFVRDRLAAGNEAFLAQAINLPHADDFDIARFTGVMPFPRNDLGAWLAAAQTPHLVFVCRDDRPWFGGSAFLTWMGGLLVRVRRKLPVRPFVRALQHRAIAGFGAALRARFPDMSFSVIGTGASGGLPAWINDRRQSWPSAETEVETCRLCAAAHIVLGVHGSNMLLPTAHAGAVIDLMPHDRWGNLGQDLTLPMGDARSQALRVLLLPVCIAPRALAKVAADMLQYAHNVLRQGRAYTRHDTAAKNGLAALAARAESVFAPRDGKKV